VRTIILLVNQRLYAVLRMKRRRALAHAGAWTPAEHRI